MSNFGAGAFALGVLLVCAAVGWAWDYWRLKRRHLRGSLIIWRCHRVQGGAVVSTPHAMTQSEAVDWAGKNLGLITYVDIPHGFIFYRGRD